MRRAARRGAPKGGRRTEATSRGPARVARKILVAEDSPTQAEHLRLLLESAGYEVETAGSGRAGLEAIRSSPPDLIISDVVMPDMDGYAFCEAVKSSPTSRRIPFVLLTGHRSPADIIRGLERGADNFITKPFEDDYLLERILRIFQNLEHRRAARFEMDVTVRFAGREIILNADKQQMIELLFATSEELADANQQLDDSKRTVKEYARTLEERVQERTRQLADAEARYRTLVEQLPAVTYVGALEEGGKLFYVSPQSEHLLGLPSLELLSDPEAFRRHVHPEDLESVTTAKARSRARGEPFSAEYRLLTPDGRTLWVRDEAVAIRDDSGRPRYLQGVLLDVTERKHAEETLKIQARQQAALAALGQRALADVPLQVLMDEVVGLVALTLGVEYCKVLELLPDGKALLLRAGVGWREGYVGRATVDAGRQSQAGYTLLSDGPVVVEDLRTETRFDGPPLLRDHAVVSGMSVVIQGRGRPFGVLGTHTTRRRSFSTDDVTFLQAVANLLATAIDRERTRKELERQREALHQTEKLAAMGSLLAGVAHELNNPLSVIIGQTELLRRSVEGKPAERAGKIGQAAERCARIVKNFLALARQQPPERQRVTLTQVVEEALELVAYPLRVDGIELVTDLAPDLPPFWADSHQLHQVLVNLAMNAHHALRGGPAPRRITVRTRYDPKRARLRLEVADTGPGIPPDVRSRIFEPFFTTKPAGQGTGLGLSLCRGIVESHGGTLEVESEPGQGTVFRAELPIGSRPASIAPVDEPQPAAGPATARRILVVDDEAQVAELLAELLSSEGHTVDKAENGVRALEKLAAGTYDLILSDIKMPELDGPGLHREVERRYPGLERRFVFLTGDTIASETQAFLERTGSPGLSKPFHLEEALRVVRKFLETPSGRSGKEGA